MLLRYLKKCLEVASLKFKGRNLKESYFFLVVMNLKTNGYPTSKILS